MSVKIIESLLQAGLSKREAQNKSALFDLADRQLAPTDSVDPMKWFVPGRIEVLGKHTDYAGWRSLLCTA